MRSKNHKAISKLESAHMGRVKNLPCSVCDAPAPSIAHHIRQQRHWLTIPLCEDCHVGSYNGIHGQARIWSVLKLDELDALNITIGRLHGSR